MPHSKHKSENPENAAFHLTPVEGTDGLLTHSRWHKTVNPIGLDNQIDNFVAWCQQKRTESPNYYIPEYTSSAVFSPTPQRLLENQETVTLYKNTFDSFLWSGIECSNPETHEGERWDQLELAHVYEPIQRKRQIHLLHDLGIKNIRLGMPNHLMEAQQSWRIFSDILHDFKHANIRVSLDLQHFGLPDRFRRPEKPTESIYLNPKWPHYFVGFALSAIRRYLHDLEAVTLINEPLITNKFSAALWNEGVPGCATHPLYNHYFIRRALLIAQAGVRARYEIEDYLQTQQDVTHGRRLLFVHNESCEHQPDDPDFNHYHRFLTSDLILGQDWLLQKDFTTSDFYQWLQTQFVRPEHRQADEYCLLHELQNLRHYHEDFQERFQKTMRADTVFGIDYYLACESVKHGFTYELPTDIEGYQDALKQGRRRGLLGICLDYWNRYQLPLLHTETNFADYDSERWGIQQLLELAELPKLGIPILGFNWYSLMDQFNWDTALKDSPTLPRIYPVGLVSLPDYQLRSFAKLVLPQLRAALDQQAGS